MYTPLSVAVKLRRGDVLSLFLRVLHVAFLFFSFPSFTIFRSLLHFSPFHIQLVRLRPAPFDTASSTTSVAAKGRKGEDESRTCRKDSILEGNGILG